MRRIMPGLRKAVVLALAFIAGGVLAAQGDGLQSPPPQVLLGLNNTWTGTNAFGPCTIGADQICVNGASTLAGNFKVTATETALLTGQTTGLTIYGLGSPGATNTEFLRQYYNGSNYRVETSQTGSGTARPLVLNNWLTLVGPTASGTAGLVQVSGSTSNANIVGLRIGGTLTASSGTYIGQRINPVVSLTGTGGWTGLQVNPDATSFTGSGAALLMDLQTTNVSKFSVTSAGLITATLTTDSTRTTRTVCQDTTSGSLYFGSGALGICAGTSSARYKHHIGPLQPGLAEVMKLKPSEYYYRKGYGDDGARLQYGLIAEDLYKVLPELVMLDERKRPNSVDLLGMVPVLVKAIQEQERKISQLQVIAGMLSLGLMLSLLFRKRV